MVEQLIRAAAAEAKVHIRYREVKASRGKVIRAEPISALYEQGRVHHLGTFPALEDQLTSFTTSGYMGDGSPDRADALVWALTEIFPRVAINDTPVEKPVVLGRPFRVSSGPRDNRPSQDSGTGWKPAWR
jgi:phage terminase large subunit-like protein